MYKLLTGSIPIYISVMVPVPVPRQFKRLGSGSRLLSRFWFRFRFFCVTVNHFEPRTSILAAMNRTRPRAMGFAAYWYGSVRTVP